MLYSLPYDLGQITSNIMAKKITLAYTNMPTSKTPYDFGGIATCKKIGAFLPSVGDVGIKFSALSHHRTLLMCLTCDQQQIKNPNLFMEIFNKYVDEFIQITN